MKNKMMKILIMLVTIALIMGLGVTMVQATTMSPGSITGTDPNSTSLNDMGNTLLGIIQTVGVIVAVIILAILGIKYMMGSAEEKAEYKKTFIPYIVGAVLLVMAPAIAGFIFEMLG